jgi:Kef-type K+ transport system membrane component KefB
MRRAPGAELDARVIATEGNGTQMVSESARTMELLRQRDRQKRTSQVWIGLLVVWAVVVGWVVFFTVRSVTSESGPLGAWLAYLVPLAILLVVTLLHSKRLRDIDAELLASTETDRRH